MTSSSKAVKAKPLHAWAFVWENGEIAISTICRTEDGAYIEAGGLRTGSVQRVLITSFPRRKSTSKRREK